MKRLRVCSFAFTIPAAVEESFELFSQPALLNELTPGWFDLVPLGPLPTRFAPGTEIAYALGWRGLPLRWTSRIVEWQPPHLLTYEQARGPYRSFRHEHRFVGEAGGTRVEDRVTYRAAGGWLIDRLLVRPDLLRIFRHRARAARATLELRHLEPTPPVVNAAPQLEGSAAGASFMP